MTRTTTLPAGTRVATPAGRTGTVERRISAHNGYRVRWDEPVFGCDVGGVTASMLYVVGDPALAEWYDAAWPAFVARDREARRPEVAR